MRFEEFWFQIFYIHHIGVISMILEEFIGLYKRFGQLNCIDETSKFLHNISDGKVNIYTKETKFAI